MNVYKGILSLLFKLYVGIWFLIFALLFYPILYLFTKFAHLRKYTFYLFVTWSFLMRITCFFFIRKIKELPLPKGPFIIISNHSSYLDIFMMHSLFPQHPFQFLGKGEILSYPIVRTYFKAINIPVYRNNKVKAAQSYRQALRAIEAGWSVVIFPEGGIADENLPLLTPFKDGAFKLAKAAKIPILPLTFTDHYHLFSEPTDWLGTAHPGVSRVYFHPLVTTEMVEKLSVQELKHTCFEWIKAPLAEIYQSRGLK